MVVFNKVVNDPSIINLCDGHKSYLVNDTSISRR